MLMMLPHAGDGLLQLQEWWMKLLSTGHHAVQLSGKCCKILVCCQEGFLGFCMTYFWQLVATRPLKSPIYLGAVLGSVQFIKDHTQKHVDKWVLGLS